MNVLDAPLSKVEIINLAEANDGYISGLVSVSLNRIIAWNFEQFLDAISMKLTGTCDLMDVSYKVVSSENSDNIIIEVAGDPSAILNEWPYNLDPGDIVTWTDPDNDECSRSGAIRDIAWVNEDMVRLTLHDGWSAEVHPNELS